jgi:glycosyltransferase involved in cell wall biosynthesis
MFLGGGPRSLSGAIVKLSKDESLRNRLGSNCRKLVTRSYDWDAIVVRWLNTLVSVDARAGEKLSAS